MQILLPSVMWSVGRRSAVERGGGGGSICAGIMGAWQAPQTSQTSPILRVNVSSESPECDQGSTSAVYRDWTAHLCWTGSERRKLFKFMEFYFTVQ